MSIAFFATLTGFVFGFLLSIPVGPINMTIINEGARRGFKWAFMVGMGAVVMETIYCAIAFTSLASFFQKGIVEFIMKMTGFLFMLFLGIRFLTIRSIKVSNKMEKRFEKKISSRSAFATGFFRVMINLGVLAGWVMLAVGFISHGWVEPTWRGKLSCILGVALGTSFWFTSLSYAVSLGHKKFTEKTLLRMEKFSGLSLIAVAIVYGIMIVIEIARHKYNFH